MALPGEIPDTPSAMAKASQSTTSAPAIAPTTVHSSSETNTTVTTPTSASRLHPINRSIANAVNRRSS